MEAEKDRPGFYGWWLLFFLWIVYTIPIGFVFYGPPVLYPFMIEETGWSRGDIMVGYAAIMLPVQSAVTIYLQAKRLPAQVQPKWPARYFLRLTFVVQLFLAIAVVYFVVL